MVVEDFSGNELRNATFGIEAQVNMLSELGNLVKDVDDLGADGGQALMLRMVEGGLDFIDQPIPLDQPHQRLGGLDWEFGGG